MDTLIVRHGQFVAGPRRIDAKASMSSLIISGLAVMVMLGELV